MSIPDQTFYVTTPIYYVNARPHIGHAYTTLVADTVARRHRLLGQPTFFLTGTDEHGQKIERSATAAGIPPQQFADGVSRSFRDLWDRMGITYSDFIRTTEPRHKGGVQHLFRQLQGNGAIYKGTYTGQYCVSDEAYVDGPPGIHCPDCGRLTETVSESNYYFKLSAFQRPLLDLIESNTLRIQPESRKNEVLSFLCGAVVPFLCGGETIPAEEFDRRVNNGIEARTIGKTSHGTLYVPGALKDLSISRTSFRWGIPVPDDEDHVIYVWLDALANYMTALGYGLESKPLFDQFWPADLHLVGKEIIRFHCVYWPAFLLALNPDWASATTPSSSSVLPTLGEAAAERPASAPAHSPESPLAFDPAWAARMLPKSIVAHGWLLFEESKMSKSRGNIVRTETILDAFGQHFLQGIRDHNTRELKKDPAFTPVPEPSAHDRDLFATDVLRYFLLREIPFGQDGSFSFDAMITRYNADLVNGYGNLVSRVLKMVTDYFSGAIPSHDTWPFVTIQIIAKLRLGGSLGEPDAQSFYTVPNVDLSLSSKTSTVFYEEAFKQLIFSRGMDTEALKETLSHKEKIERDVFGLTDATAFLTQQTDGYITKYQPWKLAKSEVPEDRKRLEEVLYTAAESIRILTALLYPILPYATAKVWAQLGLGDIEQAAREGKLTNLQWGGLQPGTRLGPLAPLFPRAPKELAQTMADMESANAKSVAPSNLLEVANAEHDSSTTNTTEFRTASLSSDSNRKDQLFAAEAAPENHQGTSGSPPHTQCLSVETDSSLADPAVVDSTSPSAPPRSPVQSPTPLAEVAGSAATTPTRPDTAFHSTASPSGVFASAPAATPITAQPSDASPQITIDDFAKVELRVAQILVCERIPKADKLLRLEVDLGPELGHRQILSGIAEWYTPEDLLGRRIVVITNLAPRKMRGLDSHGMLLAASAPEGGKPALATFAEADRLPLGARLK